MREKIIESEEKIIFDQIQKQRWRHRLSDVHKIHLIQKAGVSYDISVFLADFYIFMLQTDFSKTTPSFFENIAANRRYEVPIVLNNFHSNFCICSQLKELLSDHTFNLKIFQFFHYGRRFPHETFLIMHQSILF